MKILLKLILLVILTTVCYSQGKIVSLETITRDFGEVTTEVVMSVTEFNQLINEANQAPLMFRMESNSRFHSDTMQGNGGTVALKLVGGKLIIGTDSPAPMNRMSPSSEPSETTREEGFKNFNLDMINTLNSMGGESDIKIQDRNGELVLTNGDYSYNYIHD